MNGIGKALQIVAGLTLTVFNILEATFNLIQTNSKLIITTLLFLGTIIGLVLLGKVQMLGWAFGIFAGKAITRLGEIILNFIVMGKKLGWATALSMLFGVTLNMWAWIAIAALLAIIIALVWVSESFTDACGNIVGAAFWLGATLWNIVVGVINAIIQFMWTYFVEPWIGIIEWVLNVFNDGFNSFGDGVKNLLGQIISWFLSLGKVVTKIIDAIFGTNCTGGLESLQNNVLSWGKKEKAITLSREAPEVLQRVSTKNAFAKGYGYGEQLGNWTTDKISGLKDTISNKLNVGGLPTNEIMPNIEDIKGNTGKIADSMELTEEDLKYLRDVANMEWKKEFTTANITVDMTNNNNVSNDFDLNSLAIGLRDLVEEEMFAVANGTYV